MIDYGTRIKFLRQQAALTQAEFAKMAKVSPRAQFNYEKGESFPDLNYLQNLANSGFDIVYILTGEFHQENMSDIERHLLTEFRKANNAKKAAIMAVSRSEESDLEILSSQKDSEPQPVKELKNSKRLSSLLAKQINQFSDSNSRYFWFYKSKDDDKK